MQPKCCWKIPVTPVFNGSASLRDAASQMVENTTKAVRRKQTVDDSFMESLFKDIVSLYHMDQVSTTYGSAEKDLGPLPGPAVELIVILVLSWLGIIGFNVIDLVLKGKKRDI